MQQKSDAQITGMVQEAHRVAHVALNKLHSRLIEGHEAHGLANALIAGGHVQPTFGNARDVERAGADREQSKMLDEQYGDTTADNY